MKTFNIHMTLKRDKKDSDFDNINQVKSEIITWLEDLGFFVSFDDNSSNKIIENAKEFITDEDIKEVMKSENSKEFDVGYYQGLLDYEGKCQSILWEYISEKDIPEIQKEIARRLGR